MASTLHCNSCEELNLRPVRTLSSLLASSNTGCTFCSVLLSGIEAFANNPLARSSVKDLYGVEVGPFGQLDQETKFTPQCDEHCLTIGWAKGTFRLEIYSLATTPDTASQNGSQSTPWRHMRSATHVAGSTSSDEAFRRGQSWLETCTKLHTKCNDIRSPRLPPRRILDISNDRVRLLHDHKPEKYACLSHCWGGHQPLQTLRDTLAKHQDGIEWNSLPRTFQDVIKLLRRIEMQYVWIDSLCIVQDDEKDWEIEAAKMGDIYSGAYITIAATRAQNSLQGLYGDTPSCIKSTPFQCLDPSGKEHTLYVRCFVEHGLSFGVSDLITFDSHHPLLGRGWVYQERLLSPRVLHFGATELIWECRDLTWCECSQSRGQHSLFTAKSDSSGAGTIIVSGSGDDSAGAWRRMIGDYSTLDFTFEKDVMVALSGVARQMQNSRSARYLCGLWEDSLIGDLLWSSGENTKATQAWRAPSWSWASIIGPVNYGLIGYGTRHGSLSVETIMETYAKVIDVTMSSTGQDVFSGVNSGSIVLHGPAAIGTVVAPSDRRGHGTVIARDLHPTDEMMVSYSDRTIEKGAPVICLQMVSTVRPPFPGTIVVFLVLKPVDRKPDVFERVGITQCLSSRMQGAEAGRLSNRTITIV